MVVERKWILIVIIVVCLVFISIPVVLFQRAVTKYFTFLKSWNTGIIKPIKSRILPYPHYKNGGTDFQLPQPELKFVKFLIKAPKAKSVRIAADFNKWDPEELPLVKTTKESWETIVPLPCGKYNYLVEIDGRFILDPANPSTAQQDGRKVSVLNVK
jgi:hypothetical protein